MKKLLFSLIIIFFTIMNVHAEDNNYLVNLNVEGYTISPEFNKETYEYVLSVKDNVSNITINAEACSIDSIISGTGQVNITSDTNVFLIKVTKEDDIKTYKLTVIKTESNNYLKSLKIGKYELDQPFDKDTFSYSVTVPYEVTSVNVPAIAESDTSTVKVTGNTDLLVGENNIVITVTSDTGKSRVYEIIVYRSEENIKEEEEITIKEDNDNITNKTTSTLNTTNIDNKETINYKTVIICSCLFIVLIGGGLAIFHFSKQKGEIGEDDK